MTRTNYQLRDLGGALDWASLRIFVYGLMRDQTSLLWREVEDPDGSISGWFDGSKVAPMLADLFDLLAWTRHAMLQTQTKRKIKKPKPYPRPWLDDSRTRKIGKGAIAVSEFQKWWDSKSDAE